MELPQTHDTAARFERPISVFEDRYGTNAEARLLALFAQPCVTFARIAQQFGVTRERVRQWHQELLPEAPRGHARQRQCRIHQQKKKLFDDPLFRAFYRDARSTFGPNRFTLIQARDGFRRRMVRLDGQTISIRAARPLRHTPESGRWKLAPADRSDFIYYRLGDEGFLFVPGQALPDGGTVFAAAEPSDYARYRDTFTAALNGSRDHRFRSMAERLSS